MDNERLAAKILSLEFDGKRFAIGKNAETLKVHAVAQLAGIVDDSSKSSEVWQGIPLVNASNLPWGCGVINCATSIAPISAEQRVRSVAPSASLIPFETVQQAMPDLLRPPSFVLEMNEDWQRHESEWLELRAALADNQSKAVFDDVVQFRRTGSYAHMLAYKVQLQEQYFDDVCSLRSGEVFVDCGGFDGDTTEQFVKRCPNYERVWFFEPSQTNMRKAKDRLKGIRHIQFIPKGVSDHTGNLSFDADAGSASAVMESGINTIDVTTIDEEIPEKVSFIKMDLEGWELKALAGARRHIQQDRPKLAIAVYHRASDFRNVPRLILDVQSHYDLYLRHYTEGWSETVMYFIPR